MRDSHQPDLEAQEMLEELRTFLLMDVRKGGVDRVVRGVFNRCFPDLENRSSAYRVLYGARDGDAKAHKMLSLKNKLVILVSGCQDELSTQLALGAHAQKAGARMFCIFAHTPFITPERVAEIEKNPVVHHYILPTPPAGGLGIIAGFGKFRCLLPDRPYTEADYRTETILWPRRQAAAQLTFNFR